MSLVVGLDIGSKTVSGAVFNGSAKKFRLVDFFTEEIPSLTSGDYDEDGDYMAPLSIWEHIDRILTDRQLKGAEIITAVDTKDCVVREISVPFLRDEQIRKTVFFEAESHFTGFDLESTVLEYIKVGEFNEKSQLVLAALRDEVIESHLGGLKEIGVDPAHIDLDSAALFNAYARSPLFDETRSSLLIDMGATSTKILLVENGRLKKLRSLRLETAILDPSRQIAEPVGVGSAGDGADTGLGDAGTSTPDKDKEADGAGFLRFSIEERFQEIEDALKLLDTSAPGSGEQDGDVPIAILSDEEYDLFRDEEDGPGTASPAAGGEDDLAELLARGRGAGDTESGDTEGDDESTREYGSRFPGAAPSDRVFDYAEYLQRISIEIQRSFAGVRLESPIDLICLTGGMSRRDDARHFFTQEFDVETVPLEFGDEIPNELPPRQQELLGTEGSVAVGLGLKALGGDRLGLDFRKGPYRYEHKFERVKVPLLVASLLLFVLFLQATFWAFHDWKKETRRLDSYKARNLAIYSEFFSEKPKGTPWASANKQKRAWEGKGAGDVGRYLDSAEVIADLSNVMKDSNLLFAIKRLDFKFGVTMRAGKKSAKKGDKGKSKRVLEPRAEKSSLELETAQSDGVTVLERKFRDATSKVFTASGSATPLKGDRFKLDLTLEVKDSKLKEFTQ